MITLCKCNDKPCTCTEMDTPQSSRKTLEDRYKDRLFPKEVFDELISEVTEIVHKREQKAEERGYENGWNKQKEDRQCQILIKDARLAERTAIRNFILEMEKKGYESQTIIGDLKAELLLRDKFQD